MNPFGDAGPEWLVGEWAQACIDAGALVVQRCNGCLTWRHPPRRFCASCQSRDGEFTAVAGHGTVISFAVSHRSLHPTWQAMTPFVTLVIELDEGPRVLAATGTPRATVAVGLRVVLDQRIGEDGHALLWATPSETTGDLT